MKEIVIDLRKDNIQLNETYLGVVGAAIKYALTAMFPGSGTKLKIFGDDVPINRFLGALAAEKRYLDSYNKSGLTDPKTYKNKYSLDSAIESFEKETGLKWPLK